MMLTRKLKRLCIHIVVWICPVIIFFTVVFMNGPSLDSKSTSEDNSKMAADISAAAVDVIVDDDDNPIYPHDVPDKR